MKTTFSSSWKASTQPRKQKKYVAHAPLHVKTKLIAAHLSKELRKQHGTRAMSLRKGDKVKIYRGQFKGKTGKVERIALKSMKVYASGIEMTKRDGSKALYPLHASNLEIQELAEDKRRIKRGRKEK